jgi:hypothetical protein
MNINIVTEVPNNEISENDLFIVRKMFDELMHEDVIYLERYRPTAPLTTTYSS